MCRHVSTSARVGQVVFLYFPELQKIRLGSASDRS